MDEEQREKITPQQLPLLKLLKRIYFSFSFILLLPISHSSSNRKLSFFFIAHNALAFAEPPPLYIIKCYFAEYTAKKKYVGHSEGYSCRSCCGDLVIMRCNIV